MPDTAALWVPMGEGYTVTETPPEGWQVMSGTGYFEQCGGYSYGDTCYHTIENFTSQLQAYRVYIAKLWNGFLDCEDEEYEGCGTAFANSGLNAPAQGGYYNVPGPDYVIRNIITATSDLGTLVCDWVPDYYDVYFGVAFGELECRMTSVADGYPSYYEALWVPADGTYTVTENPPAGWRVLYGTGTFSMNNCMEGSFGNANSIPVGGYYEDGAECVHLIENTRDEGEPTPEPTPEITPTDAVTPAVTPTETSTSVPTDEPSPEPTPEGVCGGYALTPDGFPIINLSNAPCGDDSEGAVVNFSPIETRGDVCINEAIYHSNGGGTWDIWRTADDIEPENLTNGVAGVISMAPTRSPNGRYVAYVSNADGDWEIYLIDLNNPDAPAMQLTNNTQAIDLDPVFSPSGRYIAYESNVDGDWEIRLIDLTTGEKFRITRHPANDINPFWSSDGARLLFQSDRTGKWQIFVATSIAGNNTVSLLSDGLGEDYDPTYSPNGERIAFRSERNGEMGVYIMDSDGRDVRKVSLDGYTASTPVWDSSNRYIAYQASKAGESLNDIFVYDTVSGETRQLTSSVGNMANVQDVAPTWLCNSTTVIFTSDVSGNNRLYALNALPISAPPVDLTGMSSWTENDFNNRDPQNTPSEENGSRMGALPPRTR
jgi:Tol biopolymer transport system component